MGYIIVYIPQDYKDVALFKKNSYWIYKNEKTSKIDSTYVKSDPFFWHTLNETQTTDYIDVYFGGNLFEEEDLSYTSVDLYLSIDSLSRIYVFSNFSNIIVEKLDSLSLNNNKFTNIYHTRHSQLRNNLDTITFDTYLVPHIGIIKLTKKLLGTDTTISILRWNVSQ